ncbi:MAG: L-lactate dehydrogenase [Candidatus Omnitrophica bacterium]|nr:L-lactate dehydrogenase [Candidatus Omnitrophota bacterium]
MKSEKPKVAIVGAGSVGSTFAFSLMESGLVREITLIDRDEARARGECMDLNHGLSFTHPTRIYAAGIEGCAGADVVVITAGAKQRPAQTRIDLAQENVIIFKEIIPAIARYAPEAILIVVTNPVDILTYVALRISGFPASRVFGSGTVLDTSRFRFLLSEHCNVDPRNVHAYIIGEHGDTELPVFSNATIAGMPLREYCPLCNNHQCDYKQELQGIFERVKNAAYQIIEAKGATYYAVALALLRITEAVLRNENSILPVSTLIQDYYGINDVCLSVPCLVHKGGVKQFLRLALSQEEQAALQYSAQTLKAVLQGIKF